MVVGSHGIKPKMVVKVPNLLSFVEVGCHFVILFLGILTFWRCSTSPMVCHFEPTIWALITEAFEDLRQSGGAEVILLMPPGM